MKMSIILYILVFSIMCSACGSNEHQQGVFTPTNTLQAQTAPNLTDSEPTNTPTQTPDNTPLPTKTLIPPTATITMTPTLGIGSIQKSEMDGMALVYVPEGTFIMGSSEDDAIAVCQKFNDDCESHPFFNQEPAHNVYLDAFWIDQTEVTNAMYLQCVKAGKCNSPKSSVSSTRTNYYGNPEFNNYPVIYVSWEDASAYCEWAGRRLPTEAEWEKAASWDEINQINNTYPWGNQIDCTYANFNNGTIMCVGDTTAVGSYPKGISFYGSLDMIGNVMEYVADWFDDSYYRSLPDGSRNPINLTRVPSRNLDSRVIRGGSFGADAYSHSASRYYYDEEDEDDAEIGFRCALSATQ